MNKMNKQSKMTVSFSIIKHRDSLNSAITADGFHVYRQENIWVEGIDNTIGRLIYCAPDDVHFIYVDPMWKKIIGRWQTMCTCGSIAGIYGYKAYDRFGSPEKRSQIPGEMVCCVVFIETGKHADGSGSH